MRIELPTQAQIMEELADRVAALMDLRRPVAFDGALDELIRYHRFVLGLGASTTEDGAPFNYAEVAGEDWDAPHRRWLRQYRRLYDRAANLIPESDHYLVALAYTQAQLLRLPNRLVTTRALADSILDLFPGLMHAVEAWVTRRAVVALDDNVGARRAALAGSDAKAHAATLRRLVGVWESLFAHSPALGDLADRETNDRGAQWGAAMRAWPFAWTHLAHTAYCLALAVWNEDEEGALVFRETLVRWPDNYDYLVPDPLYLRRPELLFPGLLEQDEAVAGVAFGALTYAHDQAPAPGAIFASALEEVHADVLQLVASLLVYWATLGRPAGPLAAKIAGQLIARAGDGQRGPQHPAPSANEVLLRFMRFQMAGDRWQDGSYGARLDGLVQTLDRLTERDVVAGRIYTPSTVNDREQTLWADVALIAAHIDQARPAQLVERVKAIAENAVADADRSLRNVLHELERYTTVVAQRPPAVLDAIELLGGEAAEHQLVLTGELVEQVNEAISQVRVARLREMPIDLERLEERRAAVDAALLDPANREFFPDAKIEAVDDAEIGELCTHRFPEYPKSRLTNPTMGAEVSNEVPHIANSVAHWADSRTFWKLERLPKEKAKAAADPLRPIFWESLRLLRNAVGPDPQLVLPLRYRSALIDVVVDPGQSSLATLPIRNDHSRRGGYVCHIDGIEVRVAGIKETRAWLFSGRRLERLRYGLVDAGGQRVKAAFELDRPDETVVEGVLVFQFRQQMVWADTPIYDILLPRRRRRQIPRS
jgi:hypothetical protein